MHPTLATSYFNLATIEWALGNPTAARVPMNRAHAIYARPNHPRAEKARAWLDAHPTNGTAS